jgi:hypothetical protein
LDLTPSIYFKAKDVSEEYITSIFMVEIAEKCINVKGSERSYVVRVIQPETLFDFRRTMLFYIAEDGTVQVLCVYQEKYDEHYTTGVVVLITLLPSSE